MQTETKQQQGSTCIPIVSTVLAPRKLSSSSPEHCASNQCLHKYWVNTNIHRDIHGLTERNEPRSEHRRNIRCERKGRPQDSDDRSAVTLNRSSPALSPLFCSFILTSVKACSAFAWMAKTHIWPLHGGMRKHSNQNVNIRRHSMAILKQTCTEMLTSSTVCTWQVRKLRLATSYRVKADIS